MPVRDRTICNLALGWRDLVFEPFRPGVEIHWIYRGPESEPSVALLKYQPGAAVPRHRHAGLETIFVLDGSQIDEDGSYPEGSFVFNPAGSEHSVRSEEGCVVLIQWDKPVIFLEQ